MTSQSFQANLYNMKSIWQRSWTHAPCGTLAMKVESRENVFIPLSKLGDSEMVTERVL